MVNKKIFAVLIVIASGFIALNFSDNTDDKKQFGYLGVDACTKACHNKEKDGNQLQIWKESKHAEAYKTLQTPEADSIAHSLGYTKHAVEIDNCLRCHASGYNVEPSIVGERFNVEDGIQCETCHGAGAGFRAIHLKKEREKSAEAGMIFYDNIEEYCHKCHNAESPTYVELDFASDWEKIKHDVPKE